MEWNNILEKQPENGSIIIHLDRPFELYNGDFKNKYTMGMREYKNHGISWNDYLKWCDQNNAPYPNYWWIYAKDFPFPDQPERSKREDLNCDNCKDPRVFNCCWDSSGHKQDKTCDYYQFKMRCSEHCRNAVRGK